MVNSAFRHWFWITLVGPLVAVSSSAQSRDRLSKLTVCALLEQSPEGFDHKRIQLEGVYRFSSEIHGLYGDNCRVPLILDGRKWPAALDIILPPSSGRDPLQQAIRQVEGTKGKIILSVIGKLNVDDETVMYIQDGRRRKFGFGGLVQFPMQFKVEQVISVRVEQDANGWSDMRVPREPVSQ